MVAQTQIISPVRRSRLNDAIQKKRQLASLEKQQSEEAEIFKNMSQEDRAIEAKLFAEQEAGSIPQELIDVADEKAKLPGAIKKEIEEGRQLRQRNDFQIPPGQGETPQAFNEQRPASGPIQPQNSIDQTAPVDNEQPQRLVEMNNQREAPSALLVDRLRAFQERRLGKTPSNQFTKMEAAEAKAQSGSNARGMQVVKLRNGQLAIMNKLTGEVKDQAGNLVPFALFDQRDRLKAMDTTLGTLDAKESKGLLQSVFQKTLNMRQSSLETRLKDDFTTIRTTRNALGLFDVNAGRDQVDKNFVLQSVILNMVPKITENRATDEDRRFVLDAPSLIRKIKHKAGEEMDGVKRKILMDSAQEIFARMNRVAEKSIRFAISNEAHALRGRGSKEEQKERIQSALQRMSASNPAAAPITYEEHLGLQEDLELAKLTAKKDRAEERKNKHKKKKGVGGRERLKKKAKKRRNQ